MVVLETAQYSVLKYESGICACTACAGDENAGACRHQPAVFAVIRRLGIVEVHIRLNKDIRIEHSKASRNSGQCVDTTATLLCV